MMALSNVIFSANSNNSSSATTRRNSDQNVSNIGSNCPVAPVELAALNVPVFNRDFRKLAPFYDISSTYTRKYRFVGSKIFFYLRWALAEDALSYIECLETT